jgi:hypothetical protein
MTILAEENESPKSSHFLLTSGLENLYILEFSTKDIEDMHYDNDFLQDNIVEMSIAKVSYNDEHCLKRVINDVKPHVDKILNIPNRIISVVVENKGLKHKLVKRLLSENTDTDLQFFDYEVDGVAFFFLFKESKTSTIRLYNSLGQYFLDNFQMSFNPK